MDSAWAAGAEHGCHWSSAKGWLLLLPSPRMGGRMVQADISRSWIFSCWIFPVYQNSHTVWTQTWISPAETVPTDGALLTASLWGVAAPQLRRNRLRLTLFWQNNTELVFGWRYELTAFLKLQSSWSLGFTYGVGPWSTPWMYSLDQYVPWPLVWKGIQALTDVLLSLSSIRHFYWK